MTTHQGCGRLVSGSDAPVYAGPVPGMGTQIVRGGGACSSQ
jgi:hypothetical protein